MKFARSSSIPRNVMALAVLAVLTAGCAQTSPGFRSYQPSYAGTAPDVARLLHYCDKMADQGRLNLALGMCGRAHEKDPGNPLPLLKLAGVLSALDRDEEALRAYRALLAVDPDNTEGRYRLSLALIDQNRYQEAREELEFALGRAPEDARLYNALAVMTDKTGDHETAQQLYRAGLGFAPDNLAMRSNLGLSLVLAGQHAEGLALLEDVAGHPSASEVSRANLELAYAHIERGAAGDTAVRAPVVGVDRRPVATPDGQRSADGMSAVPLIAPPQAATAAASLESDAVAAPVATASSARSGPPEAVRKTPEEGAAVVEDWLRDVFGGLFDE